ncbi:hypothetical protein CBS101457_004935 [Exobasidium rhododendri]|nr:hypothetical protein CBS101457_004935 [Exobasidium rhododendri]
MSSQLAADRSVSLESAGNVQHSIQRSSDEDGSGRSSDHDHREKSKVHIVSFDDGFYPHEYRDPLTTPVHRYNLYNILIAINCFLVSLFASAYLYVAPAVQAEFDTTVYLSRLPFVFYVMMWGIGPLFLAPLADVYGRKIVALSSTGLWIVWHVGAARSNNLASLTVTRTFAGLTGTASFVNGASVATDVAQGLVIAKGIALYCTFVFLGPVIGPILGSLVAEYAQPLVSDVAGWRWVFYAAIIAGSLSFVSLLVFLPETNRKVLLQRKARRMSKEHPQLDVRLDFDVPSLAKKMEYVSSAACRMVFAEPIILFISLWQTTVLGVLYLFFEAYPIVYGQGYGFSTVEVGAAFLGIGIGMTIACAYCMTYDLKLYVNMIKRRNGDRQPELRTYFAIVSATIVTLSLFWFGFTTYTSIHWIVSIIATTFYGFGMLGVILCTFGYTVDTYGINAGPAFAAESFLRSMLTSILPLFGDKMFNDLNPRFAVLVLACISLLEIAIPVLALLYGSRMRKRSALAVKS